VIGFIIAVAVFQNIVAVAWAFVIGSYLLLPLNLYLQHRYAGISVTQHLWELRWVAVCTALMAAAVIATKTLLAGHVRQDWLLLLVEVTVGAIAYVVALLIFERTLFREVVTFGLQAIPGGDRIGRLLGIKVAPRRAGGKNGRRRDRMIALEAEAARAESREVDMGMDIAADMGVDEPSTADI
jgi:hypothetical protein